jgi:hypothetical protein
MQDEINEIYSYFKQYPQIYGGPYFRFLKANIEEHLKNGTYIHRDGAFIAWKIYKRESNGCQPGWVLLDKLVNSVPGTGAGKKLLTEFLDNFGDRTIVLKRLVGNEIARRLYLNNGFMEEEPKDGFVRMIRPPNVPFDFVITLPEVFRSRLRNR